MLFHNQDLDLFQAIPVASLLLSKKNTYYKIEEVNTAYVKLVQIEKEILVAQYLEQIVQEIPHALLNLSLAKLKATLTLSEQTGKGQKMPLHTFLSQSLPSQVSVNRYFQPTIQPKFSAHQEVEYFILSFIDVTDWVQTANSEKSFQNDQVLKANDRFISAQHIVHFGYWEHNLATDEIFWSEEMKHILGYSAENAPTVFQDILKTIHPEDKSLFEKDIAACLQGEKMHNMELRILLPDNTTRYVQVKGNPVYDEAGNVACLAGTIQDITERKLAELAIQESEEKYRVLFYDSPVPRWVYDLDSLKFLEVNKAAIDSYGYSQEEFLQMTILDIRPADDLPLLEPLLRKNYQSQTSTPTYKGHWRHKKKNGEIIYVDVHAHQISYQGKKRILAVCHDLTDILKTQEALAMSNNRFHYVMRATNDAIWDWDLESNSLTWGEGLSVLFGYKEEDFPRTIEAWIDLVHPEDQKLVNSSFVQTAYSYSTHQWQREYRFKLADGSYAMVLDRGFVIRNDEGKPMRMVGAMQNVTDQKRAEQRLKSSEEFRRLIINASLDAVICTDLAGIITLWSPAAEKIFGWSEADMLGKQMAEYIIPEQYRQKHAEGMDHFVKTGEVRVMNKILEMSALNRKGQEFPVELTIVPIHQQDSLLFCSFIRDISYRKQGELLQQKMTQEVYEQNRDLQQFTYMISHNLRAPVANAIGLSNLLPKNVDDPALFKRTLNFLRSSLLQLDTVLKDVSLILSIRDNKDVLDREEVNLTDVITEAFNSLIEPLYKCQGDLSINIDKKLVVHGNRAFFHSIFYNLLSNAIKYRSDERLLKVNVSCVRQETNGIVITFEDNGSGFDLQKAGEHVFKLYKRFHASKKGRGIGLFLVKTHVEAMGGKIQVQSEPNVGTKFMISLP